MADLGEAWRTCRRPGLPWRSSWIALSGLPLLEGPSRPFYVYFPTQEPSGLRFIVHGDFYVVTTARRCLRAVQHVADR